MTSGFVVEIFLHTRKSGPMRSMGEVLAEARRGLVGDTYDRGRPTRHARSLPDQEVTLIEVEALAVLGSESGIDLPASQTRRNVVTRGVDLNSLVGVEFSVGDVRLRGIRLCDPCKHLERLTQPGVLKGLANRGGLRAEVLQGGMIQVGSSVITPISA